jgi:hypothetical protein
MPSHGNSHMILACLLRLCLLFLLVDYRCKRPVFCPCSQILLSFTIIPSHSSQIRTKWSSPQPTPLIKTADSPSAAAPLQKRPIRRRDIRPTIQQHAPTKSRSTHRPRQNQICRMELAANGQCVLRRSAGRPSPRPRIGTRCTGGTAH